MALDYFEKSEASDWRALLSWSGLAARAVFRPRDDVRPRGPISDGKAGGYCGLLAVGLSRVLGIIGRLCASENIPRLNVIVARRDTAEPGRGVILQPRNLPTEEQQEVLDYPWFNVAAPGIQLLSHINETTVWR